MPDPLNIGIIGAGGIARAHMTAISAIEETAVGAVFDIEPERARAAAAEFGGRICATLEELLADEDVQAVHVCTPHAVHAEQVIAAAHAGKHVLVEKPMALSVADCDRMLDACRQAGRVLMVGQVLRYWPGHRQARRLIAAGRIGRVDHMMRRRYSLFAPSGQRSWYADPQIGGNCVLYAFGSHEYDFLHWLIDSPVVRVYARGTESAARYRGQKDSFTTVMTHASGTVSVLSQSVSSHAGAWDQHVVGSGGSLFLTPQKLMIDGEEVDLEGLPAEGMERQIAEFAACCLHGGTPDASGDSARHTYAIIEAAQRSDQRGEPVELAELDPPAST
jgi:predicted dehydrogenase